MRCAGWTWLWLFSGMGLGAQWDTVLTPPGKSPLKELFGYSEFTPAYQQGIRPYETHLDALYLKEFKGDDDTYAVSAFEEKRFLIPGLEYLAKHWLTDLQQLTAGESPGGDTLRGIPAGVTKDNIYWTDDLPKFPDQPIVSLTPLTLSRFQESLGRTHPWNVYGGSEKNWEEVFWRGLPGNSARGLFCRLLKKVYGKRVSEDCDLKGQGLRVYSQSIFVPDALTDVRFDGEAKDVKFLVTFLPYARWPQSLQAAYHKQNFQALPSPSTLIFSDVPLFSRMKSPEARQIPLAQEFSQFAAGWNRRSHYDLKISDVSRKISRFTKSQELETRTVLPIATKELFPLTDDETVTPFQQIFSPSPAVIGLYDKPLARNVQMWAVSGPLQGQWLLDGPVANGEAIRRAERTIGEDAGASRVHHRNYYPVMQINGWEVRWYRPLVAWFKNGESAVDSGSLGTVNLTRGTESLWFPMTLGETAWNDLVGELELSQALAALKVLRFADLVGKVPRDVATALMKTGDHVPEAAKTAISDQSVSLSAPLTFDQTKTSAFELGYWKKIVALSEELPYEKNNCDCSATNDDEKGRDPHCEKNHQSTVRESLATFYESLGLKVHSQKFEWKMPILPDWWDGPKQLQENLIVVIHGKDGKPHDEAILMADHYDTAYMEDIYEKGDLAGHRHASKGADDNFSATAALMEAARVLKDLPLQKDVWLVHLTGEEFPADGLGTRALAKALVNGEPLIEGKPNPKIAGMFVLDMVAHHTDRKNGNPEPEQAIFQISPGRGKRAAELALTAHRAALTWNDRLKKENWDFAFKRKATWKRYSISRRKGPTAFPDPVLGKYLSLRPEIRPDWHLRSSLYNTDAQIYSDVGIPVVLFMENYDINRQGYHDSRDTIENIDLDYGRGVVSIAIETVAQAASR